MSIKALIPSVVIISFLSLLMSIKALIFSGGYKYPESPDEYKSTYSFSGGYRFPESPDEYKSTDSFSDGYKFPESPDEYKSNYTFSGGYKFLSLLMSIKALIPSVVVISLRYNCFYTHQETQETYNHH